MPLWDDPELEQSIRQTGKKAQRNTALYFTSLFLCLITASILVLISVPALRGLVPGAGLAIDHAPGAVWAVAVGLAGLAGICYLVSRSNHR